MKHVLMQEAQETGEQAGAGAPQKKRAPKTNLLDIVRGRMPLACVAAVRFQVSPDKTNADVAKVFGTSVGKIFDIRKGRNFGYVDANYKPSAEDIEAAKKWAAEAAKHGGDEAVILAAVDKLGTASADEAKVQAEKITAARSKGPRGPRTPKASTEQAQTAKAEDLLK